MVKTRGGQTFFLTGQISLKYCIAGRKKFFALFFLHKDHIIDVNFGYFIHKFVSNSLDVHPKFDTGAEENLWRAACGPRAALWPPLVKTLNCCRSLWLLASFVWSSKVVCAKQQLNLSKLK